MTRSLHTLLQYLRHSIPPYGDAALSDAQMLERWVGQRDPAAFELMLWRHGPMVLNTCRRLLPRREDIEDAFQATFLVLVRKASSIRRREALAAWLPWSDPILSGPLPNVGRFDWKLPDKMPSDFYVRIHVRDKAGNDGYAVTYVNLKKDD